MPIKDFTTPLKNLNGEAVKRDGISYPLKTLIIDLLLAEGERGEYRIKEGLKRAQAGALAVKLNGAVGPQNYEVDELALIKERVLLLAPPLATTQILPYLDSKE